MMAMSREGKEESTGKGAGQVLFVYILKSRAVIIRGAMHGEEEERNGQVEACKSQDLRGISEVRINILAFNVDILSHIADTWTFQVVNY